MSTINTKAIGAHLAHAGRGRRIDIALNTPLFYKLYVWIGGENGDMSTLKANAGSMAGFGRRLIKHLRSAVESGLYGHKQGQEGQSSDDAVQEAAQAAQMSGQEVTSEQMGQFLRENSQTLHAVDKRKTFPGLPGVPEGMTLGWVQHSNSRGAQFALGVFLSKTLFTQLAVADSQGRVFVGGERDMDTQGLEPVFMFGKERNVLLPFGRRFGKDVAPGQVPKVEAILGGIIGQDPAGHMCWLASWLKRDNRYTLEQLRPVLPPSMRYDLEYRDAIAISFFAAYMLPRIGDILTGFGAGNIFRRLNREAPMGAIRRSVQDTLEAHAQGLRTSGLEDYFSDLMKEAGALKPTPGLEAVHGAEPMHLYASSYSGAYMFSWNNGMELSAALQALRIEGNLNRFAQVSTWLERNARIGAYPIEDTVTRVQAAELDQALLNNPAIAALHMEEDLPDDFDPVTSDGRQAATMLVSKAEQVAAEIASEHPDPVQARARAGHANRGAQGSEWVYRQAFARLLRSLRLPFRFDVEFRSNLGQGQVAIAFTSAGRSMMPSSRFASSRKGWVDLSDAERSRMSADYNLRVGLMMAALAFGADPKVAQVSLHIDSLGLEEALAQQDSAIAQMMTQALAAFEQARTGSTAVTGSKGDPKDGDIHGDPNHMIAREQAAGSSQQLEHPSAPTSSAQAGEEEGQEDDEASLNQEFADLMQGVDLDAMAFAAPSDPQVESSDDFGQTEGDDPTGEGESEGGRSDPLAALRRNPTVRNLVTVTFTRELFLAHLRQQGLKNPQDFYRFFEATMDVDAAGGLEPVNAEFDMRDERFAPRGSQDEPELEDRAFDPPTSKILGAERVCNLSIQRADVLEQSLSQFRQLASESQSSSAEKAHRAMGVIESIGDPELAQHASEVTRALIDDQPVPDLSFNLSENLDQERLKARDLLFSGNVSGALEAEEGVTAQLDTLFNQQADQGSVPRFFNSYAERVVYNRLFATPGERTLLIPDNLFYAHLEMADIYTQFKQTPKALKHLNTMVSYAPAYSLSHLKLAVQLARGEDWNGARAATLNALQVALDRSDAAFAYYRFAYAAWMRDEFAVAAAAYIMAEHISPGRISDLSGELEELTARADSQCIPVPRDYDDARMLLQEEGLPVWPHTKVADIVRQAARVCVDAGLFVPARTLSVAAARMNDDESDGLDMVEVQFLQSLNA
ncbi:hypothetical protein KIM372_06970 [Bombiscardovia nodaiensis]|uniref:Tetratricopeptide repeat protein n=1 Tax=Bombiscardovia nodaiensis TaxID=2932181 RepID=A0ABM8B7F4_9BIFI|nr:hypothetical protein KIM372_06970 [Bombiscardovia nodaiensis]